MSSLNKVQHSAEPALHDIALDLRRYGIDLAIADVVIIDIPPVQSDRDEPITNEGCKVLVLELPSAAWTVLLRGRAKSRIADCVTALAKRRHGRLTATQFHVSNVLHYCRVGVVGSHYGSYGHALRVPPVACMTISFKPMTMNFSLPALPRDD